MSAAQLPEPGVEVLQVFRTQNPTVLRPQLVPVAIGVAKQVLGVLVDDGAGGSVLNPDATVELPAFFIAKAATGSPAKYTGLNGLILSLSIDSAYAIGVTFADPTAAGLSPSSVVQQINDALKLADVTSIVAETVGTTQFRVRSLVQGEFASLTVNGIALNGPVTSGAVVTAFGLGLNRTYQGVSSYDRYGFLVPATAFPDPKGNLEQLAIEQSTIRAFLVGASALSVQELSRTSTVLRYAQAATYASVTGSVVVTGLSLPAAVTGLTLQLKVDGGDTQTVTFTVSESSAVLVVAKINADTTGLVASLNGSNNLVLTADTLGYGGSIQVVGGTAAGTLGLAVATTLGTQIQVVDDGNGDAVSPLLTFPGANFTTAAAAAVVTAAGVLTAPADGTTLILSDGGQPQTITFASAANIAAVVLQINAVVGTAAGGKITASDASTRLRLTHSTVGTDSVIHILGGTALANLDPGPAATIAVGTVRGTPNLPLVGDVLFVDGVEIGQINQVAPGGTVTRLKLNKQLPINAAFGINYHIIAKGLPVVGRPDPDLQIDLNGAAVIKQDLLRTSVGVPLSSRATVYLSFRAVRRDVTALAKRPGLLRFSSTTQLEQQIPPVNTENPLALGSFFGLLNAAGAEFSALGVDEISADSPYGTPEAFARAATLLESYNAYALAPLTHDLTVASILATHAKAMAEPENKAERIVLVNPEIPRSKLDTLVASGSGNSVGASGTQFDTGLPNLSSLLLSKGVDATGALAASVGVFLDIDQDAKRYSVSSVSGSIVTVRSTFAPGENDDGFYATTDLNDPPLQAQLIDAAYSLKVRGAPLLLVDGTPDLDGIAETVQALGKSFGSRRVWMLFPDRCAANIEGLEQEIPGFYLAPGIAGMVSAYKPSQSFTNMPLTGYTRVIGSNDTFSRRQLNTVAAGGVWIIQQTNEGGPLTTRMALTTDMTSVESRTDSITKVVDYTAMFIRRSLISYIGRYNINKGLLETINTILQGLLSWLVDTGVLNGFSLNRTIQDPDNPDSILVDVTLEPPYPCNYIRAVLAV